MTTLKPLGAYSSIAELYHESQAQLETSRQATLWEIGLHKDTKAQLEAEHKRHILTMGALMAERSAYKGQELLLNDVMGELEAERVGLMRGPHIG